MRQKPNAFGLSTAEMKEVIEAMGVAARIEGFGVGYHDSDVVNDAFVLALCKPVSERPPIEEWKRFVGWMCTLAKFVAMTTRHAKPTRIQSWLASEPMRDDMFAEQADPSTLVDIVEIRELFEKASELMAEDRLRLVAQHVVEEIPITELAKESNIPENTLYDRFYVALGELRSKVESLDHMKRRKRVVLVPLVFVALLGREAQALIHRVGTNLATTFSRCALRFIFPSAACAACLTFTRPSTPQTSASFASRPFRAEVSAKIPSRLDDQNEPVMVQPARSELTIERPLAPPARKEKRVQGARQTLFDEFNWLEWVSANEARRNVR